MGDQVDQGGIERLRVAAWEARKNSYTPYSKFPVGAALLTKSGNIYTGCNIENISFGLTICAERSAVASAVNDAEREFFAIAVAAETEAPIVPCGACRQFLAEFNPSLNVWSFAKSDVFSEWNLSGLLPFPSQGILDEQIVPYGT